ncbi:MAG TPA: DUF2283 domain-containing protein [Polyangiaceae bacterium]
MNDLAIRREQHPQPGLAFTYDPEADASYIYVVGRAHRIRPHHQVAALEGYVVFDVDDDGRILGIEILGVSRVLRAETLEDTVRTPLDPEAHLAPLDRKLLAAGRGDPSAAGELYAEHKASLLRVARRALGSGYVQDAEDVVHEFFLALGTGELEPPLIRDAALPWMKRMVRSMAEEHLRSGGWR